MAPRGAWTLLAALPVLLGTVLPGCGGATTSVDPPEATLPHGGSLRVNCSTTCDQPSVVGLETVLKKVEVSRGANWKLFELDDVQQDSKLICFANCDNNQTTASMSLTVYRFPELVELAPLPFWQPVGENFTLSCLVEGGAPRNSLTVVLLRGEEELGRQPVVGEPAEVPFTMSARKKDHGANFSCRTELDLRSQGVALFKNSSTSKQLRTFVLPETDPLLTAPQIFEVGQNTTVNCSLKGVFPAGEAQVYLTLGDQPQNPVMVPNAVPVSVTATVMANKDEESVQTLKCVVIVGNQSRSFSKRVTVYSFQGPNLTLSNLEVSESTEVTVVCQARDADMVTLSGVPALTPTPTPIWSPHREVQYQFNASAEDNGRSFTCSAALEVDGMVLYKNQTQELRVLYGPRLNEQDCPGNWTWKEGSEQTLKCQAWGNPHPKLNCHRKEDAFSLPIGDLRPVKREHSGIYLCQAVSTRGEVTRQVVVNVLYPNYNLAVIITVVLVVLIVGAAVFGCLYNRQRKIRKYQLQKAQEAATSMKLNMPPSPP